MRHLALLASVYTLVAVLVLPSSLLASEDEVVPPAADVAQTGVETAPAEPPPATTQPPSEPPPAAPAPAAAPEPGSAPPPEPGPAPPPEPAEQQPLAEATAGLPQELGDEREKRKRPKPVVARAAASLTVTIQDFNFAPAAVTVDVGDTVTWENIGPTAHSATADNGSFDTGVHPKDESRSHTFDEAGTFTYYCKPHPQMKGTVTVQAAGSGGGGGGTGSGDSGSGTSGDSSSPGTSSTDPGTTGSTSGSGSALPDTGADPATLAILGLLMLAFGAAVQRRAHTRQTESAGRGDR